MNCEEFALIGLDAGTDRISAAEQAVALSHVASCEKCAALADSWQGARARLADFAAATRDAQAPARVEMRLLQELRAEKRPPVVFRRVSVIATWGLAAAATIVGVISWHSWKTTPASPVQKNGVDVNEVAAKETSTSDPILIAEDETTEFTPLPGAMPAAMDDGAIYQVRMQRASLGALGLPVNEEGASDWIKVDVLVADDGTPQAVRLHEDANESATAVSN